MALGQGVAGRRHYGKGSSGRGQGVIEGRAWVGEG